MTSPTPVIDRIQALDGDELAAFLGSLWRRAGWEVDEEASDAAGVVVWRAVDGTPERAVLRPISPSGVASVDDVTSTLDACDYPTEQTVVISTTGFTPDARRLSEVYGVDTMGAEGIARIVVALGADDLFDRSRPPRGGLNQPEFGG